jgi:hypothetical protein
VLSAEGSAPEGKGLRSLPMVFMDEGAEAIAAHDRTGGFGLPDGIPALGYSKIEAAMRPLVVVVLDVHVEHRFEMAFVRDEDPIETFSPDSTNDGNRIGRKEGGDVEMKAVVLVKVRQISDRLGNGTPPPIGSTARVLDSGDRVDPPSRMDRYGPRLRSRGANSS